MDIKYLEFDKCTVVMEESMLVLRKCMLKHLKVKRHDVCN